ncbi:MAG: aromatic ring-hydroxylating dioxygenase subunit alpha [Methylococcaceae bacterium]|nr:MAG: aromatic ring-hydroxylating dioxygenase subunit alpha [Methylococcaceae bacterium]
MLSHEDNELLTRIGKGTPMGDLLRQYWMPAALSTELSDCDGAPLRVRLLGENLIAFRASSGQVGLVAEACPHRGASLFFGRNEAEGLRCAYHGWKFDNTGRCSDLPNEAPDCPLKHKVKLQAYPCRERNGVVWTYMGPRTEPPPLPDLEWNLRTDNIPFLWRNYRACNWVQAMEGDIDSSHINFLHSTLDAGDLSTVPGVPLPGYAAPGIRLLQESGIPRLEVRNTAAGALHTSARRLDDGSEYHRVHPFLFPFHTMVGGGTSAAEVSFNGKLWVPMDDEQTLILEWQFRPDRAWSEVERTALLAARIPHGLQEPTSAPAGIWRPRACADNDYLLDRRLEKTQLFCGILSNPLQDAAMQESMGAIVDRTREHLGPADTVIIRVRRLLIDAARALREHGTVPPGVDRPDLYLVRPVGMILPAGADWAEATRERRVAAIPHN